MNMFEMCQMQQNILTATTWNRVKEIVKQRDKYKCQYCGEFDPDGEPDHVLPISKGGTDALHNVVWACQDCNRSKGDKTLREWVSDLARFERDKILKMIDGFQRVYGGQKDEPQTWSEVEEQFDDMVQRLEASVRAFTIVKEGWLKRGIPKQLIDEFESQLLVVSRLDWFSEEGIEVQELLEHLKQEIAEDYPSSRKVWDEITRERNGKSGDQLSLL